MNLRVCPNIKLRWLPSALFVASLACTDQPTAPAPAPRALLLVIIPDIATSGAPDLYALTPSGDSLQRLTQTSASEHEPTWSPDGKFIAYTLLPPSGARTAAEIHVMNADGTGDRRLVGPGDLSAPAWSPDGTNIAFDQNVGAGDSQRALMVIGADGSNLHPVLDRGSEDRSPAWSPDGATLAFTSNCLANVPACWATTVWTVRLADTTIHQLTFPDSADSLGQDDAAYPQWSPNGTLLAIQHGSFSVVALLAASGGTLSPVTTGAVQAWSPTWSPTGAVLAFVAGPPSGPAVWLAEGDGTQPRFLANVPGILRTVRWRP